MRKRVVSALLALVMVVSVLPLIPVAAAGYSKAQLDSLVDEWNSGKNAQNKNTGYGGATQCAAFTRFLFDKLWGHYDSEGDIKNNELMPSGSDDIPCTTAAQLMDYLKTYAKPGDSFRLKSFTGNHIMHLYDIDIEGKLSIYESNFEGNSKNKARFLVTTLKDLLGDNQTAIATVNNDGSLNRTVYLTIIHALNNTATQFSFVCDHEYKFINDNKVACKKCSAVYALPTPTDVKIYMDVTKNNAPAHSSPYGDADVGARYDKGHTVYVVGKVQNAFNNTWYKLSSGEWMVSDYLGEHYHCWNSKGFCTRCLGQGDDIKIYPIWLGDVPLKISSGGKKIPVHYAPYGDSLSFKTIKDKSQVIVDAKIINSYGNVWYRLQRDAGWIYGGYLDTYAQDAKASKEIIIGYGPGPSPSVYTKMGTIPAGKSFTVYPKEISQEGGAAWISARYGNILGFIPSGTYTTTGSGKQVGTSETPEATGDSVISNLPDLNGGSISEDGTGGGGSSSSSGPSRVTVQYPTDSAYLAKKVTTETNAVVVANVQKPAGSKITAAGLLFYSSNGTLLKDHRETVTNVGNATTNFHIWYDIQAELGLTLTPGTDYMYEFYAIVDGATYMGGRYGFTTKGTAPVTPPPAAEESKPETVMLYALMLDANGAPFETQVRSIPHNTTIGVLPIPEWDGYAFAGWYTEKTGGTKVEDYARYTASNDVTLYAHWTPNQYNLMFNANGGTCDTESRAITFNTKLGTLPVPTRSGYTFAGWFTKAEEGNRVNEQTNYNASYDVTLYAHWTANQYKLIFDPNGGSCSVSSLSYTFDTIIGEMPVPTRSGYAFAGWYSKAEGGNLVHKDMRYNAPFDVTVYAQWNQAASAAGMQDVSSGAWYYNAVDYVIRTGLMSGYSADKFGPNDTLNRAMVVQVLYNKEGKPDLNGAKHSFSDVPASQWFNNAVTWGSKRGVVSGYGGGVFKPEDAVTIEQVAVILWNYSGTPAGSGNLKSLGNYSDWAANALKWAVGKGILNNVPFTNATEKATRAQTAQMLTNYLTD